MTKKRALITGITGQDGSYLAELLLEQGYEVYGFVRPTSRNTFGCLQVTDHPSVHLHEYDMLTGCWSSLRSLLAVIQPDEVYNLAAQSQVGTSFEDPFRTTQTNAIAAHQLMHCAFQQGHTVKFYQASTSELYGDVTCNRQSETTPFNPVSPYAIAKEYAFRMVAMKRRQGFFACNGILFNHESPRRHPYFVTRKVAIAVAEIVAGKREVLELGNLDAQRDWGHAQDYVKGMWLMMQQKKPDDYVLATGETHTVRDFVGEAFKVAGITLQWWSHGENEVGIDDATGMVRVRVDPNLYRPNDVHYLCGDASKARAMLAWRPERSFKNLVREMVQVEMEKVDG